MIGGLGLGFALSPDAAAVEQSMSKWGLDYINFGGNVIVNTVFELSIALIEISMMLMITYIVLIRLYKYMKKYAN